MKPFAVLLYILAACACTASRIAAQGSNHSSSAVAPVAPVAAKSSADAPAATREATAAARASSASEIQPSSAEKAATESELRLEGEKRFRTNCGRCHTPPHKFPPRVMATAIRHMRVRATLTDEDMRLILHYMIQ